MIKGTTKVRFGSSLVQPTAGGASASLASFHVPNYMYHAQREHPPPSVPDHKFNAEHS